MRRDPALAALAGLAAVATRCKSDGGIHPSLVRAGSSQEQGVSGGSGVSMLCSPTLQTAQWTRGGLVSLVRGNTERKSVTADGIHSILLRFFI